MCLPYAWSCLLWETFTDLGHLDITEELKGFSLDVDRLVGLVVKATASRAEDPGF